MIRNSLLLIGLLWFFSSFSSPEKAYRKFQEWYKTHHQELVFSIENTPSVIELKFLPVELEIVNSIRNKEKIENKEIKELYLKYNDIEEYSFKIQLNGIRDPLMASSSDETDYQSKLYYLIESMEGHFAMKLDDQVISPIRCHFENNYGSAPFVKFHLVFEKRTAKVEKSIVFDDPIFGSGLTTIDISNLREIKIPKIK